MCFMRFTRHIMLHMSRMKTAFSCLCRFSQKTTNGIRWFTPRVLKIDEVRLSPLQLCNYLQTLELAFATFQFHRELSRARFFKSSVHGLYKVMKGNNSVIFGFASNLFSGPHPLADVSWSETKPVSMAGLHAHARCCNGVVGVRDAVLGRLFD